MSFVIRHSSFVRREELTACPNSQFPIPNSQCPMPNAQCPMTKIRVVRR
ncbi:hypothetical protein [Nostoc sp.]